ncbi:telomere length regulation protein-domain-containing protein [Auriculariales sp. MPI-PUGE-AT-0066]|nr:telomere length regulation protein-domain-containing protein [Auriculariales sp. MPI-PUGE-AT-0066]
MEADDARSLLRELKAPISDVGVLLGILFTALKSLDLVPRGAPSRATDVTYASAAVGAIIPELQSAILTNVASIWGSALKDEGYDYLLEQFFCPVSVPSRGYGECVAVLAYSSLLSNKLDIWSLSVLEKLCQIYSLSDLHWAVFAGPLWKANDRRALAWEDVVRIVPTVPTRLANSLPRGDCPPSLEHASYMKRLCLEFDELVASSSTSDPTACSVLLIKFINIGLFPPTSPLLPSEVSFFGVTLSRSRNAQSHSRWSHLIGSLPVLALRKLVTSLVAHIPTISDPLNPSRASSWSVKQAAQILLQFISQPTGHDDILDMLIRVAVEGGWTEGHARILSTATALSTPTFQWTESLLHAAVDTWSDPQFIKHALLRQHQYLTLLLLLAVSNLSTSSTVVSKIAQSQTIISAVSTYLGHADTAVRRCGMLVAEELASRIGRKLKFPGWEGEGEGREWCRAVRLLIAKSDKDIDSANIALETADVPQQGTIGDSEEEVGDSGSLHGSPPPPVMPDSDDESLVALDSDDESQAGEPNPEDLEAMVKEPSLAVGANKKPRKPVYLLQLAAMLRDTPKPEKADEQADTIGIALDCAEELIRRKEGFGFELNENAVNLVLAFALLQDNYDHPDFTEKRQKALVALVACAPTNSAPALIEQYFNDQHSLVQRISILNALAIGARELAGFSEPDSAVQAKTEFPSRMLPPAQHARYLNQETDTQRVHAIMGNISDAAMGQVRDAAPLPAIVRRERQLRVRAPQNSKIVPLPASDSGSGFSTHKPNRTRPAFSLIAAECFIMPLINRFWLYLGDAQTRAARNIRSPAGSAGGLTPQIIAHFLASLGVLLHAGRHSPAYLAVLAPEGLELVIQLGTTRIAIDDDDFGHATTKDAESKPESWEQRQGRVVTAALEVALVILEGCVELDGGKSLALEHTTKILATEEWSRGIFEALEKGLRIRGGGGANETRMTAAAAGVAVKVTEVLDRWRRSLIGALEG